jgi:uncharacterized protein
MPDLISGFDWDNGNRLKCQKHGLTIAEIEAMFAGTMWVFPAAAHTAAETRYLGVGRTEGGRYVFVAYTLRLMGEARLIRPISARFMHAKEVKHFEAQVQDTTKATGVEDR